MFNLFKKKSEIDKLQEKHKELMETAFKILSIKRTESDSKYKEADDVLKEIEALKPKS